MSVKAKVYEVIYYILPEKIGDLEDIPTDIKEKYLGGIDPNTGLRTQSSRML